MYRIASRFYIRYVQLAIEEGQFFFLVKMKSFQFGWKNKIRVQILHLPLTSPALSALGPGSSEPVSVILLPVTIWNVPFCVLSHFQWHSVSKLHRIPAASSACTFVSCISSRRRCVCVWWMNGNWICYSMTYCRVDYYQRHNNSNISLN